MWESVGRIAMRPSIMACAAFPAAMTRRSETSRRSYSTSPQRSTRSAQLTQRETESETSNASRVRRKICRASSFPSISDAWRDRPSAALDHYRIHDIRRALRLEECGDILCRNQGHPGTSFIRSGTKVRREHHVWPLQSGMNEWLLLKNVQAGTGNFLRFQGMHQSGFVNHRPARSVDQKRCRLHASEFGRVKHLAGVSVERHVQRDKIRFGEKGVQIAIFRVQLVFDGCGCARLAVVDYLHCKSSGAPCDRTSDAPESDDAQRLAPDVSSTKLIEIKTLPVPRANIVVGFHHSARHSHHQRPGKIRSGLVQHAGSVGNDDTAFAACGDINVVVADGDVGDDAKLL